MKIIFSRKGFDSAAGGVPSPIFPDGRLCSLPIPEDSGSIRHADVGWNGTSLGRIVGDLTRGRVRPNDIAHLDPDLNPSSLPRKPGWRALFGQSSAAQKHLANCGVTVGDIFLFFGWFRQVEWVDSRLTYIREAPDLHVLFGWLQIGSIQRVQQFPKQMLSWAKYHPHIVEDAAESNTVYVAAPRLKLGKAESGWAGAGVFPLLKPILCLTSPSGTRSLWRLPRWFHPSDPQHALSYHADPKRWRLGPDCVYLDTVGRGQEFVLDCDHYPEAVGWLRTLFDAALV